MGFFAEFSLWLNKLLATYIGDNTAAIAELLEPAIVTLGMFYVTVWGYLQFVGKIEETFLEGVRRLVTLAVILGPSLHLWLFNSDRRHFLQCARGARRRHHWRPDPSGSSRDSVRWRCAAGLLLEKGGFSTETSASISPDSPSM